MLDHHAVVTDTTVLVVDDSPTCLYLACGLLNNLGVPCVAAATFDQAISLALAHRPRLALIDLVMPEGHGATLSAQLHALNPDIVTYAASASDPAELISPAGIDGQFAGTLPKPLCSTRLSHVTSSHPVPAQRPAHGLEQRLSSLPERQRQMFLQMITQDLDEVTSLLQRARTSAQQLHCVHRLSGILSAAAAPELGANRTLEAQLKKGMGLSQAETALVAELMSNLRERVRAFSSSAAF